MPYDTSIVGWMTLHDLKAIESIALTAPENGVIVEVGSMMGKSAIAWASTATTCRVYCIDNFSEKHHPNHNFDPEVQKNLYNSVIPQVGVVYNVYEEFKKNTQSYQNITMIRGWSPKEIVYPGDEIDIFFIDAEHKNPSDWDNLCYFLPYMKENSIVCGHDYAPRIFPDIIANVKKLEKITGNNVRILPRSSVWALDINKKITKEDLC